MLHWLLGGNKLNRLEALIMVCDCTTAKAEIAFT